MTFRGSLDYTLDSKNRLTIPAKFRATFAEGIVLALGHDTQDCITVWRSDEFDEFVSQSLAGFHQLSNEYTTLNRFYNANSHDVELDSAGRVMVPSKLLAETGLDKEVVVTGAGRCLEVWDRAAWSEHRGTLAATVKRITEQLGNPA
jgi:MraZ protein